MVTRRNIGFPHGLQPVGRYATVTIITGPTFSRKRFCSFIYDFPLDCAAFHNDFPLKKYMLVSIIHRLKYDFNSQFIWTIFFKTVLSLNLLNIMTILNNKNYYIKCPFMILYQSSCHFMKNRILCHSEH